MSNKQKENKHEVLTKGGREEKAAWTTGVYSEYDKCILQMTLEKSVRDVIKNWNGCDYGVMSSLYHEKKKEVEDTMRRCGYAPVVSKSRIFSETSGFYLFRKISPQNS